MGGGSAVASVLDWTVPVARQTDTVDPREAEIILAAECIWLEELIAPFVETVHDLLQGPNRPVCLVCYRDRSCGDGSSETFVSMAKVVEEFLSKGCKGETCLVMLKRSQKKRFRD